jgi:predicted HTH domain antitoxin
MAERITVKRASELTGLSKLTIRKGIECGDLDFGKVIHSGYNRNTYHISPIKLNEYLGLHKKISVEIDPSTVTDFKIKELQDEVSYLKNQLNEQRIVINSILDAQEYIIKKMNGVKTDTYQSLYESAINHFREKPVYVEPEEKVTVKRTAELLGTSALTIHGGLISGDFPFGTVTRHKQYDGKYHNEYHIYAKKLAEYLGISIEEVKGNAKR